MLGLGNHSRREINPNPPRWIERIKQVATATANLKDAVTLADDMLVDFFQSIPVMPGQDARRTVGELVPVFAAVDGVLLVFLDESV